LLTKLFRCGVRGNSKSFKIISLQGPKLFRCREAKALQNLWLAVSLKEAYLLYFFLYISKTFLSNYDELQRHMREDLLKIHNWFYNNLLSFNFNKTKYIIFNPKNKKIPQPNRLQVRGAEIERVRYTKHLGVMIDEKMDWSEHISYIKTKIRRCLDVPPPTWSHPRLSVYYSYIHCHLTYLAPLWGYTTNTRLDELTRFQNKAIRLIFWQDYRNITFYELKIK
jgi:hypothetical protein